MIDPRKLRHRVTIQENTPTQNATTGALTDAWTAVASVWGHLEPLSARQVRAAQSEASKVTAKLTIRYRSDLGPGLRILHISTGDVYEVDGEPIPDNQSGKHWMTLQLIKLTPSQY